MVNGGRYKNGKSIYHKSELQHISVALRSLFKIPKGTEVKDGENGVTFIYPSGKRYVRYFSSADPLVVKKDCRRAPKWKDIKTKPYINILPVKNSRKGQGVKKNERH